MYIGELVNNGSYFYMFRFVSSREKTSINGSFSLTALLFILPCVLFKKVLEFKSKKKKKIRKGIASSCGLAESTALTPRFQVIFNLLASNDCLVGLVNY